MIPGSANPLLLSSAAAGAAQYQIERSLRFNSADLAYLSRVPSVAGNQKTWTWAGWVKKTTELNQALFSVYANYAGYVYYTIFGFDGNVFRFEGDTPAVDVSTAALLRDPSAWYHVVLAVDTTQATAANRVKMYANGVEQPYGSTSYPAQNADLHMNATFYHYVGLYYDGYLADIHFIDGQALTPSSFGYTDTNGVWQPKAYTGNYGANGFHLDFADNSAATTAGIGKDVSGNGNDCAPTNNFSVAAGPGNDSLVDTPTNYGTDTGVGGEVRGNYATWNPLDTTTTYMTPRNGNLELQGLGGGANFGNSRCNLALNGNKYYWETIVASATSYQYWGIVPTDVPLQSGPNDAIGFSYIPNSVGIYCNNGNILENSIALSTGTGALSPGTIIGHAFDGTTGKYWIAVGGVWRTGDPATGASPVTTVSLTKTWLAGVSEASNQTVVANFGQRPFTYTAPSGYKALCTTNLPSTTITTSGSYTGNGLADGPFVYLNGVPTAMTINGNAVTFGTEADKLSNGFKVRTTSTTYNQNAATYNYSITSTGDPFKVARAQSNP